jgi:hypothetical protein
MSRTSSGQPLREDGNGLGARERPRGPELGRALDPARLAELGRHIGAQIGEQARLRPYAVLSAAAGIGFVAGSLLGSRLGQIAMAAGVGYMAKNFIEGELGLELFQRALEKLAPEES